jgi:hypothetical protein
MRQTKRNANMAAHWLAKAAIEQSMQQILVEDYPSFILVILSDESLTLL